MAILTLTTQDFYPHGGVSVPLDRVELDVAGDYWPVQVGMFHCVGVRVAFEELCSDKNKKSSRNS